MAKKVGWNNQRHTLKERRAYNVGYALGISGYTGSALEKMYSEKSGSVGKTSDEVLASLKGFNRGYHRYEKAKNKR